MSTAAVSISELMIDTSFKIKSWQFLTITCITYVWLSLHPVQQPRGQLGKARRHLATLWGFVWTKACHSNLDIPDENSKCRCKWSTRGPNPQIPQSLTLLHVLPCFIVPVFHHQGAARVTLTVAPETLTLCAHVKTNKMKLRLNSRIKAQSVLWSKLSELKDRLEDLREKDTGHFDHHELLTESNSQKYYLYHQCSENLQAWIAFSVKLKWI